ncbi:hypothetical protein STXM2123_5803 [Streptomyces sp. F-3]|nr:hypothetical protein STXM2123_5803 [Streptomyces sp. F-3]
MPGAAARETPHSTPALPRKALEIASGYAFAGPPWTWAP